MPIIIRNLTLPLDESEELLPSLAAKRMRIEPQNIRHWAVVKRAVDARRGQVEFVYQIEVVLEGGVSDEQRCMRQLRKQDVAWIEPEEDKPIVYGKESLPERPVVVGFGPAGMFAALRLAEHGYRPIVLERGRDVRRRHHDVMVSYYKDRQFDPTSNLLFGEGGAGTYSDGKLYTRRNDALCGDVLKKLFQFGADPDILINTRPHIGSDKLPTICTQLRKSIESLGGEVRFEQQVADFSVNDNVLTSIDVQEGSVALPKTMRVGPVILGIGHSARDTIIMLASRGVQIETKPFQIGVRIEHPQAMVDQWQFGASAGHQRLGAAEYHLVSKQAAGEHGDMFSFCMCPGGIILPSNESPGLIATNGASRAHRSSLYANAGLVITLDPAKMGMGPMEGLAYQRKWEEKAFKLTRSSYRVPVQRATDFLDKCDSQGTLETTFPLGGEWADIRATIPTAVSDALEQALPNMEKKMPGFAGENALITAPETRASTPIRIPRDPQTREAVETAGLYPVGEGAGYAGGIISAAVDGIRSADQIMARYARPR